MVPGPQSERRSGAMVSAQRLADLGYKAFSGSMMALTVFASALCTVRVYHMLRHRKARQEAGDSLEPAQD
ncbi:cytochrome c oxidase assembly-like protein 14 [Alligator mississippiensis]|uniref:Cytochrome c oxidase assembly-like protein 14 n=2 Tax=Alligator mississippiensis TaxID=8496 RepID=A0A151MRR4_ALLMI|nr:cytochrome c oxidase assembly-like protein 14 [Alligator mississippiensis]